MNLVEGNRITLLKNGADFFPVLIKAIDAAVLDVRIETYIFEADAAGKLIGDAMTRAARRGVAVRLLVDGVGSWRTSTVFFESLRAAGVKILIFRPVSKWFGFRRSHLRRIHRKIALVDGKVGFVGGINLVDDMTESLSEHPRYDYAVQVEGPLLADIYPSSHHLWRWVALLHLRHKDVGDQPVPVSAARIGDQRAAFVVRDSVRHRRAIERMYNQAIKYSRKSVVLVCPYFLPGRHLRRVLVNAAERGVAITILLQGRADHRLLQMATRALYARLLGVGIAIYEYDKSMLHGKVAVVDDEWATVGSSNLDPFSLFLNREANVVVMDKTFARELRESVMAEIEGGARRCRAEDWQRRSLFARMESWFAYGVARWAAGIIGFAKYWE